MDKTHPSVYRLAILLLTILLFYTSCGKTENEYTRWQCSITIDNRIHQNQVLTACMTPMSGCFCTLEMQIKPTGTNAVRQLVFTDTPNKQKAISNLTAADMRRSLRIGQANGVILGYGTGPYQDTFFAYDILCPNCFASQQVTTEKIRLQVISHATAQCPQCQRRYDLANGGLISAGGQGQKLIRYRAVTTGSLGVLSVY